MRILLATDCYPPPLIGGRDLHVRMLAHELTQRGHDVEVATLAGPAGTRTELDDDIPVHRIAGWSRALSRFYVNPEHPFHPTVPDPGMVRSLARLVRRQQPDVVHSHSWILHSLLPILPSRSTRLVATMHDYGLVCPKATFVHQGEVCDGPQFVKCLSCASGQYGAARSVALTTGLTAMRSAHRRVDRYIAVSTPVAQACAALAAGGGPPIVVIPPFLQDESFQLGDSTRPAFVPATGDYLMFAGALGPHKGIDVLLKAWERLDPAVPLVLVGIRRHDTPDRFPDGVIVAEDVPHTDVLRAWANCTLAVVPSNWPEPSPLTALEAMAAGRPVVASAVGGLPDLGAARRHRAAGATRRRRGPTRRDDAAAPRPRTTRSLGAGRPPTGRRLLGPRPAPPNRGGLPTGHRQTTHIRHAMGPACIPMRNALSSRVGSCNRGHSQRADLLPRRAGADRAGPRDADRRPLAAVRGPRHADPAQRRASNQGRRPAPFGPQGQQTRTAGGHRLRGQPRPAVASSCGLTRAPADPGTPHGPIVAVMTQTSTRIPTAPLAASVEPSDGHHDRRWITLVVASTLLGLFLIAVADAGTRHGYWYTPTSALFWLGLVLIFVPTAFRALHKHTDPRERLTLIILLGVALYLVKVVGSPQAFSFSDEYIHLRGTQDILRTHHLFAFNPLLPSAAYYPGLAAVTAALVHLTGLSPFVSGVLLIGAARILFSASFFLVAKTVTGSARAAAAASLIYAANPMFLFWSASFSYENLALPLAAFALWWLARTRNGAGPAQTVTVLLIVAVTVTHHVAAFALTALLAAWWLAERLTQRPTPARRTVGLMTLVAATINPGMALPRRATSRDLPVHQQPVPRLEADRLPAARPHQPASPVLQRGLPLARLGDPRRLRRHRPAPPGVATGPAARLAASRSCTYRRGHGRGSRLPVQPSAAARPRRRRPVGPLHGIRLHRAGMHPRPSHQQGTRAARWSPRPADRTDRLARMATNHARHRSADHRVRRRHHHRHGLLPAAAGIRHTTGLPVVRPDRHDHRLDVGG